MKLDAKTVAKLELPGGKADAIFFDDELTGFGIRLRASGDHLRRTWVAQYRAKGRTRRMKIGAVEKLGADEARKAAKKLLAKVELGHDPQGDKVTTRLATARTLRAVADDFLKTKEQSLRAASYRVTKLYLTGPYFKALHPVAITEITLADVAARITAIARDSGTVTAGRARSALSTLFRWAMGEGLLGPNPINPVIGTNKPQDSIPRDRVLSNAELASIWRACKDDDYGKIVRLLMLTGCRREEIGGLRWSEISLEKATLSLPKQRVKNGHPHVVPLTPLAVEIIESVHRTDRDQLFGQRSERGFAHWAKCKLNLDLRLGNSIPQWVIHDVRRSVATGMADIGVQPHIIEAALNHYSGHT
jgi:integrase